MRLGLTLLTLTVGLVLAVVSYFVLAAPLGAPLTERFANPRVPYAPTLFAAGVAVALLSAVVYEVLPDSDGEQNRGRQA